MELKTLAIPGGSDTEVQFNDSSQFGGDSTLTFTKGTGILSVDALTVPNAAVLGSDSVVFQPNADSTTFLRVLKAAGGNPVLEINTTNGRVGINNTAPAGASLFVQGQVHIANDTSAGNQVQVQGVANTNQRLYFGYNTTANYGTIRAVEESVAHRPLVLNPFGANIGVGEPAPETLVEMTGAEPYLTTHNDTHEDGLRESKWLAKGENAATGEESTLGAIWFSHPGGAGTQEGSIGLYTNAGADGDTPTLAMTIDENQRTATKGRIANVTESTGATTTVAATDHHISIQYTDTGTHTATLPALSAANHGQIYHLKDTDYNAGTNAIAVATTGADTIEEAASGSMITNGESWTLVANNTTKNWELQ